MVFREVGTAEGINPLHYAAGSGKLAAVDVLIARGASIDATATDGSSPLHFASLGFSAEVAETLIALGAVPDEPPKRATREDEMASGFARMLYADELVRRADYMAAQSKYAEARSMIESATDSYRKAGKTASRDIAQALAEQQKEMLLLTTGSLAERSGNGCAKFSNLSALILRTAPMRQQRVSLRVMLCTATFAGGIALAGCSAETADTPTHSPQTAAAVAPEPSAPTPSAVPIANAFRHHLHSDTIGQDFVIDVALPYLPVDDPMPVIYVTDGNSMFPIIANAARLLQLGAELPPVILVGIGYETKTSTEVMALRTRDLTPTLDAEYVSRAQEGPMPLPDHILPGGAARFLDFMEAEVKPLIAANYPVKPGDSTLVGDSLGGLFTLYALFNRTGSYQRYVAGSPSLWWDGQTLFNDEAAYAARADDLPAEVFLSVGALEEDPSDEDDFSKMVSNTRRLAAQLEARAYPGLNLTTHEFEGETHLSVIPATLSRGLRAVFATDVEAMRAAMTEATAAGN